MDNILKMKNRIINEILLTDVGGKIHSVSVLAKRLNVGRGSIQSYLEELEKLKVIKLEKNGVKGTKLVYKDEEQLLRLIKYLSLKISIPVVNSTRLEALVTAIKVYFEARDIEVQYVQQPNVIKRVANCEYVDLIILSKQEYLQFSKHNKDISLVCTLFEKSYSNVYTVIGDTSKEPLKIGVDLNNITGTIISQKMNLREAEFTYVRPQETLSLIERNELDCAIIDIDMLEQTKEIDFDIIDNVDATTAVIICAATTKLGLVQFFDDDFISEIEKLHKKVIAKEIYPFY